MDGDPDANLATVLGIPVGKTIGDLREETLKEIKSLPPGMAKDVYIETVLQEVIVETPRVDLITMGRGEGPSCYCYLNNLLRKFTEHLLASYDWIVMDNEAGLEHLSRRIAPRIDSLIVVVNESPLSIDCARRIENIVDTLQVRVGKKYVVANAVHDERLAVVEEKIASLNMNYLGHLPHDDTLEDLLLRGESICKLNGNPCVLRINEMMNKLGVA